MENVSAWSLAWTVLVFTGFIISVCLHEFGHAIVAYWGGDRSVKEKGYLTLNPLKYTHPTYSIVMPLVFLLLGGIPLPGAAVYINRSSLRTQGWRSAVSAAGPLATLGVAVAIAALLQALQPNYSELWQGQFISGELSIEAGNLEFWIVQGLVLLLTLEVAGVFLNLIPIPGLDGFGILEPWLPSSIQQTARKYSNYGIIGLFAAFWLVPQFNQGFWALIYSTVELLGVPPEVSPLGFYLFRQGAQLLFFVLLVGYVVITQWKKRQSSSGSSTQFPTKSNEILEIELENLNQQLASTQNAELLSAKGALLIQLQRYEDALVTLEQSLTLREDNSRDWAMKGYLCYLLNRETDAIVAYQKSLELKPDESSSWQGLGMAHCEAKEYDAAIAAYNQASRYSTNQQTLAQVLSLKSRPYFFLKRYEDCLTVLQEVLSIQPGNDTAIYNQACCYAQLNQIDNGLASLNQLIENGNETLIQEVQVDPDLAPLRAHPKFAPLLENDSVG